MANLETLELTINGNAEKASQGIDTLISRLSSLASSIAKPLQGLASFNKELEKTLKISKSIQMPSLNVKAKVSGVGTSRQSKLYRPEGKAIDPDEAFRKTQEASKLELLQEKYGGMMERYIPNAVAGNFDSKQLADGALQIQKIQSEIDSIQNSAKKAPSLAEKVKEGFNSATEGVSKFFSKVKRIATTMLIRSAIRNLIKDVKEGINNVYEWSKLNSGEFAKSFDTLKAKSQQLKNSIGAAIAPAIQAAIPIINALASAAITAFNYVNQLIALLTGQNYWTKATDNVDAYTDSVNKAGGAAKEWLASFDELNVMTSGGGGGGGGSSGITSDMFENTTKFNETLKEIVGFIKANFEDIKLIAEGIGVAILSWKLANGFLEALPALSKIAGAIGIGATIAVTIKANYLLTNEYLKSGKEGWLIASALTSAVGATIAGLIAKKIFNGKVALVTAGFTLVLSAITDIIANVEHTDVSAFSKEGLLTSISAALKAGAGAGIILKAFSVGGIGLLAGVAGAAALTFIVSTALKLATSSDNIKWGSIKLTEKQVQAFVEEKMFVVKPSVAIDIVSENISQGDIHRQEIERIITEMVGTMNVINLGLNDSETYGKIREQVEKLVTEVHSYINNAKETGKLTLQFTPTLVGEDGSDQKDWYTNFTNGWDIVDKFYADKGKEIGALLVENEKGEIIAKNPELLQTLMQQLSEVTFAMTQAEIGSNAIANMKLGLGDLTKASGEQVLAAFKQYKEDLTTSWTDLVNDQYVKQGQLVAALGKIDPDSAEYKQALADYKKMGENLTSAVKDGVNSQIEPGVDIIKEWLFGNHKAGSAKVNWTDEYFREWFDDEGFAGTLRQILVESGFTKAELDVMDMINFSGWDMLSKDIKKKFLANVKITDETIKEIAKAGVSATELVELVEWDKVKGMTQDKFIKTMTSAFGANGIEAIKHRLPDVKASQIIQFSDWSEFSNTQKLEFIDAIGKAFSNQEAVSAAKSAGIDLETAIREGMSSQNEDIRKMAEKWAELMGIEIRGGDYTVKPKVDDPSVKKAKDDIVKGVSNLTSWVLANAGWNNNNNPNKLKTDVENQKPNVKAGVKIKDGAAQEVQSAVESEIKPTITANVVPSGVSELASKLKKALTKTLTLKWGNATLATVNLSTMAGGGLLSSGDLFIANENGVPEMVGRFGNQTGVANQQQIVAGISQGVYEANEKQNDLLREQNALLRAIYEKDDGSGFPGANSALGRQIKRSLDAYSGLVGG